MSELPAGWQLSSLDSLCEWRSGGTPRRSEPSYFGGDYPWITISDLNDGAVDSTAEFLTSSGVANSSAKLIPEGTVLVALYGSIGKLGITKRPATTNQAIACALPNDTAFDPLYLFHFLRSRRRELGLLGTGVTQKNIYLGDIKAFVAPVAPRAEQTRIIAKLEELLSDLDAGVAELKAAQKKLAQYRQSLLKAAVEGALTADWRAKNTPTETGAQLLQRILTERRARWEAKQLAKFNEQGKTPPKDWQKKYPEPVQPVTTGLPELPEGWVWASASMVGDILLGRQRAPQFLTGRYSRKYLRVANIRNDWIDFSDLATMDFDETHFEKYRLQEGDILVSEGQSPELVGQSAIFEGFAEDLCFQKTLHRFRADPCVASHRFAQLVFRANVTSGVFKRLASITTNIAHLTLEKFSASPFPLPPLGEQNAIVERADELFSGTKAVDTQVRDGLRIAAAQRQNILRAAFAGQLVPQDPNDEPASVLLERIRAGRQNAPAHGRRKSAVVRHSKEEIC